MISDSACLSLKSLHQTVVMAFCSSQPEAGIEDEESWYEYA